MSELGKQRPSMEKPKKQKHFLTLGGTLTIGALAVVASVDDYRTKAMNSLGISPQNAQTEQFEAIQELGKALLDRSRELTEKENLDQERKEFERLAEDLLKDLEKKQKPGWDI